MQTYLDHFEVALLEDAATNLRDKLLIRLLFHLGCRVTEALALKVEDVDFQRGMVTIRHLKTSLKLSCRECQQRLGRSHSFCQSAGAGLQRLRLSSRSVVGREYCHWIMAPWACLKNTLSAVVRFVEMGRG